MRKISLKDFKSTLSRNEMRNVMAGKKTPECGESCASGDDAFCSGNSSCGCCNVGKCGA